MFISVIIPTYNKSKRLELVLYTLSKQVFDMNNFEVIIVDDGSNDCTCEVVNKIKNSTVLNINYIYQKNSGRAVARNKGLGIANGELIIFLDDDRLVHPDFINHHFECFKRSENSRLVVLGERTNLYISKYEENFEEIKYTVLNQPKAILYKAREEYFWKKVKGVFKIPEISWIAFATGNVCMHKKLLEEVGGFNQRFVGWGLEDTELGYRLWKNKALFIYNSQAINYHIEHVRDPKQRKEEETRNHNLFYELHPEPPVLYFRRFVYGNISLEEFARQVKGESSPIIKNDEVYHKSINNVLDTK